MDFCAKAPSTSAWDKVWTGGNSSSYNPASGIQHRFWEFKECALSISPHQGAVNMSFSPAHPSTTEEQHFHRDQRNSVNYLQRRDPGSQDVSYASIDALNPHKRTFAAPTSQLPFEPAYRYSSTLSVPQPSRGPSPSSSIASALNEQISLETLYRFPSSYSGAATRPSRHPSPASASEIAVVQSESPPSPQGKHCSHCYVTSTPLWRRNPETYEILCNACGLYLHQHHKLRPPGLIDTDEEDDVGESVYGALVCAQCNSHRTSTWRRGKDGERLCNACGVYIRLRGMDRPMSLWKKKIRPRCKRAL